MIKLIKDDVTIDMPHVLGLKYDVYKQFMSVARDIDRASKMPEGDTKNSEMGNAQAGLEDVIDALIKNYPQYKEWSKDFSFQQHMKTFQSMSKGMSKIDLTEEMSGDFLEK